MVGALLNKRYKVMNLITFDYNTIDVHEQGGILVTTSRNVAEVFGKNHKDVLRDVRNVISSLPDESNDWGMRNFALAPYTDPQNKQTYDEYLITKDGLTLLVMGYTGETAMRFKLAYIKRFNEMEQALKAKREQFNSDPILQQMRRAEYLLGTAGIEGNQMALALDKLHKNKTGESLLALTGIELVRPQQTQLSTPTELGNDMGLSGREVNKLLAEMGLQTKEGGKWQPTQKGLAAGATILDTGKKRSSGVPVTQLKWPSDLFSAKRYLADR